MSKYSIEFGSGFLKSKRNESDIRKRWIKNISSKLIRMSYYLNSVWKE